MRELQRAAVAFAVAFASTLSRADAQSWATERLEASPRHMEYATVAHGDRNVECFVAYPEVPDKAHAVILIHDISGMGDWIRSMADQVAEAGYVAIVPDLLSGAGPEGGGTESFSSIDDARRAIPKLAPEQITADLNAAAKYVTQLPASKGSVSVAGFCWGGGQALRYATRNPDLSAAMVFYGYEPITAEDVERIACPVYGFYAENDARINASMQDVTRLLRDKGKRFDAVVYEGAGHGFMRHGQDPMGLPENKDARDEAWTRWKELLRAL